MAATNPLALSYLEHIRIAVSARDLSAPYRTFFDNWFAFEKAGPFLNGASRPHWFNNPCPSRHGDALRRAHFVSSAAARTLAGLEGKRLVKDHAIPVAVLRDLLFQERPATADDVGHFMRARYRIGILVLDEDEQLTAAGLRSRMPAGWKGTNSCFARYECVGINPQDVGIFGGAVLARSTRAEQSTRLGSFRQGLRDIGICRPSADSHHD